MMGKTMPGKSLKPMTYTSSRGAAADLGFADVLLTGLAEDGGLYVPQEWPILSRDEIASLRGLSYADAAFRVTWPYVIGSIHEDDYAEILADSYRDFRHPAIAPLWQMGDDVWLMELFHGPTLAFKDYALQVVGRLFDHILTRRGARATILGATSGDTGSAAIAACINRSALDIVILHPEGRCSDIQRRQMTTIQADNVHNIAIDGSFDDCQDIVKTLFADADFRHDMALAAVNSINWARIMIQIVYYARALSCLGGPDRAVGFSVPTGNFGNVYAGYCARQMGLPIAELIVGSNSNDILTRTFESGDMRVAELSHTLSPSMDIQISSNFERLIYDLLDRDGGAVARLMSDFRCDGAVCFDAASWEACLEVFHGFRADDHQTLAVIAQIYAETGSILDPHTAIGVAAAETRRRDGPIVALATAHPAKFPQAIQQALGRDPEMPEILQKAIAGEEKYTPFPNDAAAVKNYMRDHVTSTATA